MEMSWSSMVMWSFLKRLKHANKTKIALKGTSFDCMCMFCTSFRADVRIMDVTFAPDWRHNSGIAYGCKGDRQYHADYH